MSEELSIQESTRLRHCEAVIERSMNSFYEMGVALREIRESKLYKEGFVTFEEYCKSKWSFEDRHARRLIDSSFVIDNLQSGPVGPLTERQVRPLTKIKDPEQQKQVWEEVVKESNETHEPITAKKVEEVVSRYCNPCVNAAIEFRRVFYLTPYYDKILTKIMKGEKESTYLRAVIEKHCDDQAA